MSSNHLKNGVKFVQSTTSKLLDAKRLRVNERFVEEKKKEETKKEMSSKGWVQTKLIKNILSMLQSDKDLSG